MKFKPYATAVLSLTLAAAPLLAQQRENPKEGLYFKNDNEYCEVGRSPTSGQLIRYTTKEGDIKVTRLGNGFKLSMVGRIYPDGRSEVRFPSDLDPVTWEKHERAYKAAICDLVTPENLHRGTGFKPFDTVRPQEYKRPKPPQ
ncbi:MAG: hypothetical protein HY514_00755 [Candidatus Aenigmarchaeota archaeon]|nr:hypothetical protein [Candidatus Aenigmarchaeota archaeon]